MSIITQITRLPGGYELILENGTIRNVKELMVLDFDGASNVSYRNSELGIAVENIDVAASFGADTQAAVLEQLNAQESGIFYISAADAAALQLPADFCSTIYIGDTDDLDALGGAFTGIAETTGDLAAATRNDNAFVLTNRIGSVEELVETIAHEAGHLAGTVTHDYGNDGASLDDYERTSITTNTTKTGETISDKSQIAGGNGTVYLVDGATLTLNNCTYNNNSVGGAYNGGVLGLKNNGKIIDVGGHYEGNRCNNHRGGAIWVDEGGGSLQFTNTVFSNNKCEQSGGAVFAFQGMEQTGGSYTANQTVNGRGGAIYADANVTLSNVTFSLNSARSTSGSGGAVFQQTGQLKATSCNFYQNYANSDGGVLTVGTVDDNGAILTDCKFSGNIAGRDGGCINNDGNIIATNTTFTDNSAARGGAIFNAGAKTTTITGGGFSANKTATNGGAIFNQGALNLSNVNFSGNVESQAAASHETQGCGGGAIYNAVNLSVNGGIYTSNIAKAHGGAIYTGEEANGIRIDNATFIGNTASFRGGAIFTEHNTTTMLNDSFSYNVGLWGGAVAYGRSGSATSSSINMTGATFVGNTATEYGGGLYIEEAIGNLTSMTFTSNYAVINGGGFCTDPRAKVHLNHATFTSNSAGEHGAGFDNLGSTWLSDATFSGNSANGLGGAIYVKDGNTSNVTTYCSASDARFYTNSAANGGAIAAAAGTLLEVHGATFSGNRATTAGGAIFNEATATLEGNTFQTANDTIYNKNASLTMSGNNSLMGNLTNTGTGTVSFDAAAVTTLSGAAIFINENATAQTFAGKILDCHDVVVNAVADTEFADVFATGNWNYGTAKVGTTAENAVDLGNSFTNAKGTKLWAGSNNGKTGVTDNKMQLDSRIGAANADFSKFVTQSSLWTTYANFDGIIDVTGGNYSENLYAKNASLLFDNDATTATGKLVVGGHENAVSSKASTITLNAAVTAAAVLGGDQYTKTATLTSNVSFATAKTVTVNSASNLSQFAVAGNLLNTVSTGSYTFTDSGAKTLELKSGSAAIAVGGSIVGQASKLTDSGNTTVTISGGSYSFVDGAGYIQNDGAGILAKSGTTTINVTGGTFGAIFGGVGGKKATQVSRATVTGAVAITINATSTINVSAIYGGCSGKCTGFTANTTITFSGSGSNLNFTGTQSGVAGGNATTESSAAGTSGTNSLVFSGFSGNFGAKVIRDFDAVNFSNSTVTFGNAVNLSDVKTWTFDSNSNLTWNDGINDFSGDTLNISGTAGKTIIDGGKDSLFANLDKATAVNINGVGASKVDGVWVAGGLKLEINTTNHDLVLANA